MSGRPNLKREKKSKSKREENPKPFIKNLVGSTLVHPLGQNLLLVLLSQREVSCCTRTYALPGH